MTTLRFTTLPDCSRESCIPDWSHTALAPEHRNILHSLVRSQPHSVDALGSTDAMTRMAILFSTHTGIATTPACLFKQLMLMRKNGEFTRRLDPSA